MQNKYGLRPRVGDIVRLDTRKIIPIVDTIKKKLISWESPNQTNPEYVKLTVKLWFTQFDNIIEVLQTKEKASLLPEREIQKEILKNMEN